MVGMDWHPNTNNGGHTGGLQSVSLLCVPILYSQFNMGDRGPALEREFVGRPECWIDPYICGRIDMGIEHKKILIRGAIIVAIILLGNLGGLWWVSN